MEAVMLISSVPGSIATEQAQRKMEAVLHSQGISPRVVDGANPANKELRSQLFDASGKRVYPQLFRRTAGAYQPVADWPAMSEANENKDSGELEKLLSGLKKSGD